MESQVVWEASLANRAEGTRWQYLTRFKSFVEWTGLTPDKLREMKYKEDQTAKPWERSQVENLVRQYIQSLAEKEYSCSTQRLSYAAVRSFFEAQGMPLFLKRQDRPSGCAFGSKTLTHEDIRQIKNAAECLRDKALIMFLKDSGLRESDAAKLLWRDLKDYGEGFMGFEIQTKKKKTKARGFIGPETSEVLELYRQKRLQGTKKIPPEENLMNHPVFALLAHPTKSARAAFMSDILGSIIRLVGIEGATPHGLRKFWEQNIHVEKIAYQKQMNGRALTEVERAYYWKETPELLEIYKANYHELRVEKQEFKEVEDRLRGDYERQINGLRTQIGELERKNSELKQRLNGYTLSNDQVAELLRRIEKLEKMAK